MKSIDLHPIPSLREVLVEQIWTVGTATRKLGMVYGVFLAMGTGAPVDLIVEWADLSWLADAMDPPLEAILVGWYGLTTFIGGGTFEATVTRGPTGELMPVWMSVPTFGRWAIATALWTPAALTALGLAVVRHRDGRGGEA